MVDKDKGGFRAATQLVSKWVVTLRAMSFTPSFFLQ